MMIDDPMQWRKCTGGTLRQMDRRRTAGVAFYLTNTVEFVPDEPYPTPEASNPIIFKFIKVHV
jgi:hypothetical protein